MLTARKNHVLQVRQRSKRGNQLVVLVNTQLGAVRYSTALRKTVTRAHRLFLVDLQPPSESYAEDLHATIASLVSVVFQRRY
jgi:hypothetical protein